MLTAVLEFNTALEELNLASNDICRESGGFIALVSTHPGCCNLWFLPWTRVYYSGAHEVILSHAVTESLPCTPPPPTLHRNS